MIIDGDVDDFLDPEMEMAASDNLASQMAHPPPAICSSLSRGASGRRG